MTAKREQAMMKLAGRQAPGQPARRQALTSLGELGKRARGFHGGRLTGCIVTFAAELSGNVGLARTPADPDVRAKGRRSKGRRVGRSAILG